MLFPFKELKDNYINNFNKYINFKLYIQRKLKVLK